MQGGRINTGQSQAKWVITALNNLTNIRYTWQPNLKGGPEHHLRNNASQYTDLCAELSFPVTSSERKTECDTDFDFLFYLLLILITRTLCLISIIHGCIIQLVSWEPGREHWWDSHGVTYSISFPNISFSLPHISGQSNYLSNVATWKVMSWCRETGPLLVVTLAENLY